MPDIKLADFIHRAETQLKAADISNPQLDVRVLTAYALRIDRAQLLSQSARMLTEKEQDDISALITRRAQREPVSRILGAREFWSLNFVINEATLVPRPESETLIEAALERLKDHSQKLRLLDLGTGSGCLLLTLLHEFPNATGIGIDCAARAIEQAEENAEHLGLAQRATLKINNWADNIDERFDLVISNPPYIAKSEISTLMPEVLEHDPHLALDGGADGLDAYRMLIPQLPRLLKPDGFAVFEVGEGQADAVTILFHESGFQKIATHRDLNNVQRCIAASLSSAL